jgi:heterodisulfide reductase subunit A
VGPKVKGKKRIGSALVIGGGVAGMRAAADLADTGLRVHLVEALPSLGGRVAQLGYMFPTHDCVLCRGSFDHGFGCTRPAISPVFLDWNLHPNIDLHTLTKVVAVEGHVGNFHVTLRHEPRHVDPERCINCGYCAAICPAVLPSGFEMDLTTRRAAYKVAVRSIPNAYVIDHGHYCDECRRCVNVCPTQCIDLDEEPYGSRVEVGAIILALGYDLTDVREYEEFGFGRYPNVLHSMQYERLASRSGPTEGIIVRPSDGKVPQRVAWLQCIGSRDQKRPYCSSICCMFAIKEAMLAKERLGDDIECRIFVMDGRAFNKEYTHYFEMAQETYAIEYTHCRVSSIREDPATHDLILHYPTDDDRLTEERYEMVVLSTGVEPPAGSAGLAQMLEIDLNPFGFCETDKFQPLQTSKPGIYVAGAFQSPKEIAETILDAAGAAGEVMRIHHDALGGAAASREYPFIGTMEDLPPERDVSSEPARIGVFACGCGPAISLILDMDDIAQYAASLPNTVHASTLPLACFPEGLAQMKAEIVEHDLNRVVVAACSQRTHEALFQKAVRSVGLNPYLLEMTNIREQCAWVHNRNPRQATRKAKELIRVAALRVAKMEALERVLIQPYRRALVLGGGLSGMTAALTIADSGLDVTLVEAADRLGGNLTHIFYLAEGVFPQRLIQGTSDLQLGAIRPTAIGSLNPQRLLRDLIHRVLGHHRIDVLTHSELQEMTGSIGRYRSLVRTLQPYASADVVEVEHGVVVVATGGREGTTGNYLYGQDARVVTNLEMEDWLAHQPEQVASLGQVVMIQCVESDEVGHFYCSRICCTGTMKNAIRIKTLNPDCQVTVLYKDIMTYGFSEQYYTEARRRGVLFLRYTDDQPPVVERVNEQVQVQVMDPSAGSQPYTLVADLLALSMPVVPADKTAALAKLLNLPLSSEGFFLEMDLKMRPMDLENEGCFLCGMAHYPRLVEESIASAKAAASRALTILSKASLYRGGVIAAVDADKCVGCMTCVRTCPFHIPRVLYDRQGVGGLGGRAWIDPALCQGCGTCTADCPASAIELAGYRNEQVFSGGERLGAWLPH